MFTTLLLIASLSVARPLEDGVRTQPLPSDLKNPVTTMPLEVSRDATATTYTSAVRATEDAVLSQR